MPQITRARIVNFYYNNGHRFIPDLTFSFEQGKHEAMDTLISLTNGGGKSVIVQMLMQPILPRMTLHQRRVEDYFTRPTDHSFILLEWRLDESDELLMTGIAISGRGEEDETQRGRRVRYYTFLTHYGPNGDGEDLNNLALSYRKEKELYIVPYEFLREQSKKHSSRLQCYREHQKRDYQRELANYGISAEEWSNVIREINQKEGGLTDYFELFKSGGRLIEELLLPCVEKKLNSFATADEDSSLSSIMLNYAKSYHAVEGQIRQRNQAMELEAELVACSEALSPIYNECEQCENHARKVRGFVSALKELDEKTADRQKQAEEQLKKCDEAERRLRWEESCEHFYQAEEVWRQAEAEMELAHGGYEQSKEKVQRLEHRSKILTCANLYQQKIKQQGLRDVLLKEIEALDGEQDRNQDIRELRYTVWTMAERNLKERQSALTALEQECTRLRQEKSDHQKERERLADQAQNALKKRSKLEGVIQEQKNQLLHLAEGLHIDLEFQLDNRVSEGAIQQEKTDAEKQLSQRRTAINAIRDQLDQLDIRLDELRVQRTDAKGELRECKQKQRAAEEKLEQMQQQESELEDLCRLYGLDFAQRYTTQLRREMKIQLEQTRVGMGSCDRKLEILQQEIEAVRSGRLHLPQQVQDFLNHSRVPFQSCEEILKCWEKQDRFKLLEQYPLCAYGIVLDQKDINRLHDELRADWLPAAVPVFTMADLTAMSNGTYHSSSHALAYYSEHYFQAPDAFEQSRLSQMKQIRLDRQVLEERVSQMEDDLRKVEAFQYSEQDGTKFKGECASLEEIVQQWQDTVEGLNREETQVKEQLAVKKKCSEQMQQELATAERRVEDLSELCRKASVYGQQLDLLWKAEAEEQKLNQALAYSVWRLERCCTELEEKETAEKDCTQLIERYRKMTDETAGVEHSALREGTLDGLYSQLVQLLSVQDTNRKSLEQRKDQCIQQLQNLQRELNRHRLEQVEYQSVLFSPEEQDEVDRDLQEAVEQRSQLRETYEDAKSRCDKANGAMEVQKKAITGELLPRTEINPDFAHRRRVLSDQRKEATDLQKEANVIEKRIARIQGQCYDSDKRYSYLKSTLVILEDDFNKQWHTLYDTCFQAEQERDRRWKEYLRRLKNDGKRFQETPDYQRIFAAAEELLEGSTEQSMSVRCYSLLEQLESIIDAIKRQIVQLNTEIEGVDDLRKEVEDQFCQQGKMLYQELRKLAESSRVRLEGRKTSLPMLQINLPSDVEPQAAVGRMTQGVSSALSQIVAVMNREEYQQEDLNKIIQALCRSRNLLSRYTGQEELDVKVYKLDFNSRNSQYRSWRETIIGNSGAEMFVSCFAVLVTMMNYTRSGGAAGGHETSVLVLDNPFGAITSSHLLEPLFQIAKSFRVQLICLSDISKCDVTKCFQSVIKAAIKKNTFSNLELLEAEESERVEHVERAFYRLEQISLL